MSVSTAVLPAGWRDRLVLVDTRSTAPGRGYLLDPHDCVVSKLVAGREKDHRFAAALIEHGLINPSLLAERVRTTDAPRSVIQRVLHWLTAVSNP